MRDEEIITRIMALRDEMIRQIGQFERDKVAAEDERARMAIGNLIQQAGQLRSDQVQMQADLAALAARVTLCEGRIARLEANEAFEPYRDRIDQNIGNPGVAGPKTTSGPNPPETRSPHLKI